MNTYNVDELKNIKLKKPDTKEAKHIVQDSTYYTNTRKLWLNEKNKNKNENHHFKQKRKVSTIWLLDTVF